MIEVVIPNDILKYDTKVIGPLSKREAISTAISAFVGYFLFVNFRNEFDLSILGLGIMAIVCPILACGFAKPIHGLYLEQLLKRIYKQMFVQPKKRVYRMTNSWEEDLEMLHKVEQNNKKELTDYEKSFIDIDERFEESMALFYECFPEKKKQKNIPEQDTVSIKDNKNIEKEEKIEPEVIKEDNSVSQIITEPQNETVHINFLS